MSKCWQENPLSDLFRLAHAKQADKDLKISQIFCNIPQILSEILSSLPISLLAKILNIYKMLLEILSA